MKNEDSLEVTDLVHISMGDRGKTPYVVSVGWNKLVYVWADNKEESCEFLKKLPLHKTTVHNDDILCVAYSKKYNQLYTGGADGELVAWNFQTACVKASISLNDPTTSIKHNPQSSQSKAIEAVS